ncbi:hypothetical protein SGPA1_40674 [Streptomyces misionensis JCM 4497]
MLVENNQDQQRGLRDLTFYALRTKPAVQTHHRAPQLGTDLVNVFAHAITSHCLVDLSMN